MGITLLRAISAGLPILGLAVLLIVSIWAMVQFRSERLRSRRDLPWAVVIAAIGGAAVGGFFLVVGVSFGSMDSAATTLSTYLTYLPMALVLAAPVSIASFAGYALLSRNGARTALAGTLLGPAVLFALVGGGGSLVASARVAADQMAATQGAAGLAARSSVLRLDVSDVHVTTEGGGSTVKEIRLRVTVVAAQEVRIATRGKTLWPRFSLTQEANHPAIEGPIVVGPATFAAGSATPFELTFEAPRLSSGPQPHIILVSTYEPPTVGNWVLRMDLEDETGARYEVATDVVVRAGDQEGG